MAVTIPADAVREGTYGDRVVAVEPGGVGFIPLEERHGRPRQLFWTWASPNLEFATIFVGVLAVAAFGLGFWIALAAIVLGTGLGSISHGVLSARGPKHGVPQMVLSRLGFGYRGNVLPAGLNAVTAGIGWFAVNSVSGALALNTLTSLPKLLCLSHHRRGPARHRVLRAQPRARLRAVRVPDPRGHLPRRRGDDPDQDRDRGRRWRQQRQPRRLPAHGRRDVRLRRRLEPVRGRLHPLLPRRTPARARPGGRPGSACSCPACCWRPSARRPRRSAATRSATRPAASPDTCRRSRRTSRCSRSRSARSRPTP